MPPTWLSLSRSFLRRVRPSNLCREDRSGRRCPTRRPRPYLTPAFPGCPIPLRRSSPVRRRPTSRRPIRRAPRHRTPRRLRGLSRARAHPTHRRSERPQASRARGAGLLSSSEIARRRRESAGERTDLLSLLLDARGEDGASPSDVQVRDQVMTLLFAGHDTTPPRSPHALRARPPSPRPRATGRGAGPRARRPFAHAGRAVRRAFPAATPSCLTASRRRTGRGCRREPTCPSAEARGSASAAHTLGGLEPSGAMTGECNARWWRSRCSTTRRSRRSGHGVPAARWLG